MARKPHQTLFAEIISLEGLSRYVELHRSLETYRTIANSQHFGIVRQPRLMIQCACRSHIKNKKTGMVLCWLERGRGRKITGKVGDVMEYARRMDETPTHQLSEIFDDEILRNDLPLI